MALKRHQTRNLAFWLVTVLFFFLNQRSKHTRCLPQRSMYYLRVGRGIRVGCSDFQTDSRNFIHFNLLSLLPLLTLIAIHCNASQFRTNCLTYFIVDYGQFLMLYKINFDPTFLCIIETKP